MLVLNTQYMYIVQCTLMYYSVLYRMHQSLIYLKFRKIILL
jgi:hypothetical protein